MWNKWNKAKANRVLPREHTGHNKHPLPTTQEKTLHMDITRWSILKSDWLYSLYPKMDSSIQSVKIRPGADCGSDHELLLAKFRLKLKKGGKTTRPFKYDLNQILMIIQWRWWTDLRDYIWYTECLKNHGQMVITLYRRQSPKPSQRKRNARKQSRCLRRLANSWGKKRSKEQGRKGKIYKTELPSSVPEYSKER